MKKSEAVPIELARMAKEVGFDLLTEAYYTYYKTEKVHEEDGTSGPFGWEKGETTYNSHYFRNFSDIDSSNENYDTYAAPSKYQLQKWLREKKGIILYVTPYYLSSAGGWAYNIQQWDNGRLLYNNEQVADDIDHTFDEALIMGMKQGIKLIKRNE